MDWMHVRAVDSLMQFEEGFVLDRWPEARA